MAGVVVVVTDYKSEVAIFLRPERRLGAHADDAVVN